MIIPLPVCTGILGLVHMADAKSTTPYFLGPTFVGIINLSGIVQDTVVLWSNLSCIRSGGHGFEPRHQHFDECAD